MSKEKRFIDSYEEGGAVSSTQIIVDKETGVNYLIVKIGYGIGITPLLDKNGKPIISEGGK